MSELKKVLLEKIALLEKLMAHPSYQSEMDQSAARVALRELYSLSQIAEIDTGTENTINMHLIKIIDKDSGITITESLSNTPQPAIAVDTYLYIKHKDRVEKYYVHSITTIMEPHEGLLDGCGWTTNVYVEPVNSISVEDIMN